MNVFVSPWTHRPAASIFTLPPSCSTKNPPLCDDEGVKTIDMVVAQPVYAVSKYNVSNQVCARSNAFVTVFTYNAVLLLVVSYTQCEIVTW